MKTMLLLATAVGLSALLSGELVAQRCQNRPARRDPTCCAGLAQPSPAACAPAAQCGPRQRRSQAAPACVADCKLSAADPAPVRALQTDYVERLQQALAIEIESRLWYDAAAKAVGLRRYANLARAEQHHETAIRALITKLGAEPREPKPSAIEPVTDRAQADAHCAAIERKVIELYRSLIADCPDDTMRPVLEHIQVANHRHLAVVGG